MTQRGKDTIFFFYDAIYDFPGFLHLLFSSWGELGKPWSELSTLKVSTCSKKVRGHPSLSHTFIL